MNFETFDASYISRLRSGDASTEQHFVGYFTELITLKLRSKLRTPELIDDVRQETFSRTLALVRNDGLRQAERLGSLVNSICNHVLMEQYRSSDRVDGLEKATPEQLTDTRKDALSEAISKDSREIVKQVLDGMNLRDRNLLRALLLEERDKDEVCRELGVEREYLRVLLHRAKGSFRDLYSRRIQSKSH
ncbi:hypothetical protein BH10ACI4_BH10ACI4_00800 [soil metagenome]